MYLWTRYDILFLRCNLQKNNFMKNFYLKKLALIALLIFSSSILSVAQKNAKTFIEEKNVRAQLNFLAGDAMQGRGSGSMFERIAAEYIGSQFMQFGLEAAGEKDALGNPTYVQTVEVAGRSMLQEVKIGGELGNTVKYGKDFIAFEVSKPQLSGELQRIKFGETPKKGTIVLITPDEDAKFLDFGGKLAAIYTAGAEAIVIVANKELREQWSSLAERKLSPSRRGGNLFFLSPSAAEAFSKVADGTRLELTSQFAEGPKTSTWNAIGKITGTDPKLASEIILLTSHLDHLGVRPTNPGDDKLFNGADDDASGSVAVLELARVLAMGKKPKRTVYFVCFGSEEAGGFGARYFVNNLPFPKEKLIANLEFEMIGRPDAKVKPEELWLTGYERSNLGPELAKQGAKLVQDPHPEENFFQRSDNIQLARQGIIAHTVSSFGLHTDYHKASDEVKTIDFNHMTRAINSMVKPVQWLVNSNFVPTWNEGKKP
jgi:hypothetical protein